MTPSERELHDIASELRQYFVKAQSPEVAGVLQALKQAAEQVGKAWSESWLGYHANVYYRDFRQPPPGAVFSAEWGLSRTYFAEETRGDWVEYIPDVVENTIRKIAGDPDMDRMANFVEVIESTFKDSRDNILSIIEMDPSFTNSHYLSEKREEIVNLSLRSPDYYLTSSGSKTVISKDRIALNQGERKAPHLQMLARVYSREHTIMVIKTLADSAEQLGEHFARRTAHANSSRPEGGRIFLGHGHSYVWRELKEFLENRLNLSVDEFNRVATAGTTTSDRLMSMLDEATFAFLVMTGEDETPDGKLKARENVVHEVGLFQGHLGFQRAIILLEDGCEEFTNIAGLTRISFPKGQIKATFEEIRRVLEREGVIKTPTL